MMAPLHSPCFYSSSSSPFSSATVCSSIAKKPRFSLPFLALAVFLLIFSSLYGKDLKVLLARQAQEASHFVINTNNSSNGIENEQQAATPPPKVAEGKKMKRNKWQGRLAFSLNDDEGKECDVFSGSLVRDEAAHPLYREADCPYIPPQLTCKARGRPDTAFQRWRWQPHDCTLPAFDAARMLEALWNKRMLFVGNSLNRGQFMSMVCLLQSAIDPADAAAKSLSMPRGRQHEHAVFTARDYNATVEFYWAPFLLPSNSDDASRVSDRVVRRGSIDHHGRHWKGADVVVFNTYLWWCLGQRFKVLRRGSLGEDAEEETVLVPTEEAYRMAFRDMLQWVRDNMDFNTTRVFFTSMLPTHGRSQEWGGEPGGNCYNETTMIEDEGYWGSGNRRSVMRVIREILDGDGADVPLTFLNITQLSMYRKDAHTSIYKKRWSEPTAEQLADPKTYADCVHWCLPSLQDTWNELLYSKLLYP